MSRLRRFNYTSFPRLLMAAFPGTVRGVCFPDFCLRLEPRARSDPRTHGDAHTRTQTRDMHRTPMDTQTCTRTLTPVCRGEPALSHTCVQKHRRVHERTRLRTPRP